jgi:Protein of unknown function (DUF1566)
MAIIEKTGVHIALAGVLLLAGAAQALSKGDKCEATKLKLAGKYGLCRLKAEATAVKRGDLPEYAKCDDKFLTKWSVAERKAAGQCPTNRDGRSFQALIIQNSNELATALSIGLLPGRFVDNADGTITDKATGRMWEKKTELDASVNFANLHDANNYYPWAGVCSLKAEFCQPTTAAATLCAANAEGGTTGCDECGVDGGICSATDTIWTFAVALNAANFASHTDWRIPTRAELQGIVDYAADTSPTVDVAFQGVSCGPTCTDITDPACSCTQHLYYWSASTHALIPENAWYVNFGGGELYVGGRNNNFSVRAVRGGP